MAITENRVAGCLGERECKVTTIPENVVTKLKEQENVRIVSSEGKRPIAISGIRYGDENWSTLLEWAAPSLFQHVVSVVYHPKPDENWIRASPNLRAQYLGELKALCRECSLESITVAETVYGRHGDLFNHGKSSWTTLPAKLQEPGSMYPVLAAVRQGSYMCDIMYQYADCLITIAVYKNSQ